MSFKRSRVKSVAWLSRDCAACNRVNLSGEIRVGDVVAPVGVSTPIMHCFLVLKGEVGGTREAYGPWRDVESLLRVPLLHHNSE
jgi:hypothetical protein